MNKKLKILLIAVTLTALYFTSGCSFPGFGSLDSMMHPPRATGDKAEIQKAIEEKAKSDYLLSYPKSGSNRSSITTYDLDNDESDEAIALLTIKPDTEDASTHIYIIDQKDNGEWTVVGDFSNQNNDIDCLEFGDLNGDGLVDILVGWNTYNVNQHNLYCYLYGEKIKEINTNVSYSSMVVGNFMDKNKSSVMAMTLATTTESASGKLVSLNSKNIATTAAVEMDSNVTKFVSVEQGAIDSKTTGVFVDGLTSSNTYNTQVLYYRNKKLDNPIYLKALNGTLSTARSTSTVCQDIDNDGMPEIPITKQLPYTDKEAKNNFAYETSWSNYEIGSAYMKVKSTVVINNNYNYSISIPDNWIDNYTAQYNGDSSVLTFYRVSQIKQNNRCTLGEEIVRYIATQNKDWISIGSKQGYTKIQEVGKFSYGYKLNENSNYAITKDEALELFVSKDNADNIAISPTEASN